MKPIQTRQNLQQRLDFIKRLLGVNKQSTNADKNQQNQQNKSKDKSPEVVESKEFKKIR